MQALIGQFSRFAVENNITKNDWEMAATEFGVHGKATNIDRFYRSWHFGDDDRQVTAARFLRSVADDDEDVALGIMRRMYTMANSDEETLQQYPALEVLEDDDREPAGITAPQISIHSEQFLDIDNVPGTFYPDLVENINRCYSLGIYDATLVLTRKLLENLVIDILRDQYGKQEINLYYLPDNHRFSKFSDLIDSFETNLGDFKHLSGGLDSDFIDELNSFRQDANAEAHSIETNITESDIEGYREQAQHASKVLFRVWRNM
ncbi:hypothetical protein [Halococcoides cellulosivorans]|uniref:AbiJ N-terminal domain-containing protein n=1 Tax=Halococcoides cellulosivorans TaxID=1679096 RepID=A0A2R4X3U7_9EURY|nr:hypothetical protein [Halococcoides cellulosivorans]AWB28471.1 hypothetical protein HARCEL1_12550 [Halococcoides cellulosivorans]